MDQSVEAGRDKQCPHFEKILIRSMLDAPVSTGNPVRLPIHVCVVEQILYLFAF
jgi:hypothetical protein